MKVLIYDNSFEGLLCALYTFFTLSNRKVNAIADTTSDARVDAIDNIIADAVKEIRITSEGLYQAGLFDETQDIDAKEEIADKMSSIIKSKICRSALENLYLLYLSEASSAHELMVSYLCLGFKYSSKIDGFMTNDVIKEAMTICRRVRLEKHRFLGFIRFSEIKPGLFYSKFDPDYNILPLITPHFAKRMSNEDFIIHDEKRNIAAVCSKSEFIISEVDPNSIVVSSEDDLYWQKLWKNFYESITIKSRLNKKQMLGYMPSRYWKNLNEKNIVSGDGSLTR